MEKINTLSFLYIPILCLLIIMLTKMGIEYYPLSFGLVLGVLGSSNLKFGFVPKIILILLASYGSFFIGYFSFPIFRVFLRPILSNDLSGVYAIIISVSIIAPLLLFLFFNFIFDFPKTIITKNIIIFSILILLIINILFLIYGKEILIKNLKKIHFDHYAIWQVVMGMAIQLIIYQKIIWSKQKHK